MSTQQSVPEDHHVVVDTRDPSPGALAVIVRQSRLQELNELQKERTVRIWRVRGVVSDHVPLVGGSDAAIARTPQHLFELNENPLSIYLHRGGTDAIYFDLVGDANRHLEYIEVRVETDLPSNALLLARRPLSELLDTMARSYAMPLVYQRLELISPRNGEVLAYEMILPFREGVRLGPLGGIIQATPFAPYDAILREAMTSTSPFYQLLCASRVYEGTNWIRRWLREQCDRFGIKERLPAETKVDPQELLDMGFAPEFTREVRTAQDLFNKFRDARNAIAHFLVEGDEGESHVYLADGTQIRSYSLGAAALLRYAQRSIGELRRFYNTHLQTRFMAGAVLPGLENRDRFVIRDTRK